MPIRIHPSGRCPAPILIVGEAPGAEEERFVEPFVGRSGEELNRMLHDAGLIRADCRITNIVSYRPPKNDISLWLTKVKKDATLNRLTHFRNGYYYNDLIAEGLKELNDEISRTQPQVIIALGNSALWALTGHTGITDWRGSVLPNSLVPNGPKVIPTYHPALVLRQWEWRAIAVRDLRRVASELEYLEIRTPPYRFTVRPSIDTVLTELARLTVRADTAKVPLPLSVDIETRNRKIACIGIAESSLDAICIPLMCVESPEGYWTGDEEFEITLATRKLLTHENVSVIGQNFLYDAQYFAHHYGYVPRCHDDTMLMQHVAFAGLPKGLDFLSSMYCRFHQFWKNEGKHWDPQSTPEEQLWVYNCLTGDTPVLMGDLTLKPLQDVKVDDLVLGFDDNPTGTRYARRLRTAWVVKTAAKTEPVYKVTLRDGRVLRGTGDHKIMVQLVSPAGKLLGSVWKPIKDLRVGNLLVCAYPPLKQRETFEDGWLAGIFDGEGCLGVSKSGDGRYPRVAFSQKVGTVYYKAVEQLQAAGYSLRFSTKASAEYVDINGGLAENLRLLIEYHPSRLVENFERVADREGWSGFTQCPRVRIASIELLGEETVYDITTTSGTFIANGIVVHNCKDAVITYEVWEALRQVLDSLDLQTPYRFQMTLFNEVLRMMLRGVRIDLSLRKQLGLELLDELAKREQELIDIVGGQLNPRSPKQMHDFFYYQLALPEQRNRKTGRPSLDDEALTKLCNKEPIIRPLARNILEQRRIGVFNSTFVQAPLDTDQRMRCSFNIAGTETYRFSSSENAFDSGTNLQNIPKGDEDDVTKIDGQLRLPNIRKLFIPDRDYTIFDCDLSGADAQVVAWEADDKLLKQLFREKVKIHAHNAKDLFGPDAGPDGKREPYYSRTKQGVHLSNYGGTSRTLSATIGISIHEADKFQKRWFEIHPQIKKWHERIDHELQTRRFVTNRFGYRRFYFGRVEELLPEALAWIPQSTVACVTNRALVAIGLHLAEIEILLQVHDSLVGQYLTRCEARLLTVLEPTIRVIVPYNDPLIIPWGLKTSTKSWGDCVERKWPKGAEINLLSAHS